MVLLDWDATMPMDQYYKIDLVLNSDTMCYTLLNFMTISLSQLK